MSSLIVEVSKIEEIKKHPNADKLDLAIVKGWQCIVGRGQHISGELVVFCPPDSIIPDNLIEKYKLEFLKKNGKVGTIKLRGEVSQGLILEIPKPLGSSWKEGLDVSTILGIRKWESPERPVQGKKETIKDYWLKYREGKMSLRRLIKKSFYYIKENYFTPKRRRNPLFSEYTDIENIKNFNKIFEEGEEVVITEKIHGSNFRAANLPYFYKSKLIQQIFPKKYSFIYGSRTVEKTFAKNSGGWYKEDIWAKIVEKYNLDKIIPKGYTIYGEIYGPKVQDLTYGLKEIGCLFFDIKYGNFYLGFEEKKKFFENLGLPMVPVLFIGKYSQGLEKIYTEGKSVICPSQIREGCVLTSKNESLHPKLGRKILKSISIEYLTRKDGTEYH